MSLFAASINSGSNGNCYYIGTETEAVLVDAGISCREIEKRMKRLGLSMESVKAVFISHEHIDHIRGVEVLSKKHNLPVYISERTLISGGLKLSPNLVCRFHSEDPIALEHLSVKPFTKHHDAADPYSFNISGNGVTIGVYTDIGHACDNVIAHFKACHAVFLETNYDEIMLDNGAYPPHLKRRIKSDKGHLSNLQALELFKKHRTPHLGHLFLSHLSKENNSPKLVEELFLKDAETTNIIVASRYSESGLYRISAVPGASQPVFVAPLKKRKPKPVTEPNPFQTSLF